MKIILSLVFLSLAIASQAFALEGDTGACANYVRSRLNQNGITAIDMVHVSRNGHTYVAIYFKETGSELTVAEQATVADAQVAYAHVDPRDCNVLNVAY